MLEHHLNEHQRTRLDQKAAINHRTNSLVLEDAAAGCCEGADVLMTLVGDGEGEGDGEAEGEGDNPICFLNCRPEIFACTGDQYQ